MSEKEEFEKEPWHVRKEITAGHLLITLTLIGGAIGTWINLTKGVDANTMEIAHVKELNRLQSDRFMSAIARVESQFEKIDNKLDAMRKEIKR